MKIDINKKYRYRNGKPARILCVDGTGSHCGISQPVVSMEEDGDINSHYEDGRFRGSSDSEFDLIEVREPREFWIIERENGEARLYNCQQTMGLGMTPYPNQIRVREIID
jgi:hypothetical protein